MMTNLLEVILLYLNIFHPILQLIVRVKYLILLVLIDFIIILVCYCFLVIQRKDRPFGGGGDFRMV